VNHIGNTCPLTKFEDGLSLCHEADDDAVIWLEPTATAALAKNTSNNNVPTRQGLADVDEGLRSAVPGDLRSRLSGVNVSLRNFC